MEELDLLGADKWHITFGDVLTENGVDEFSLMENDYQVARAMMIARKIINNPETSHPGTYFISPVI